MAGFSRQGVPNYIEVEKSTRTQAHEHVDVHFSLLLTGAVMSLAALSSCCYDFPTATDYKPELGPKINPLFLKCIFISVF